MFTSVLTAVASFEQVFLRENDIPFITHIELIWLEFFSPIKSTKRIAHAVTNFDFF